MILFSQPFVLERHMLEPLLAALPSAAPTLYPSGARIAHEPTIGRIIPDVVLADPFPAQDVFARVRLTFLHCHALAMAHGVNGVSCERMRSELHVPMSAARRVLNDLTRRDFLVQSHGSYFVANSVMLSNARLVAIEIKMKRWREALNQALSYRAFADQAVVVLDGNQVKATGEVLNAFHTAGVGLILQYGSIISEVLPAPTVRVMSPERVWAFTKIAKFTHR